MMKNASMKKILCLLLCVVLFAAMTLITVGCGSKETPAPEEVNGTILMTDKAVYGTGKTEFSFEVKDADGNQTTVTVKTDKETVGEALVEHKLIAGSTSEWGLMVETINGITLNYDESHMYWAFYINGEYAMTGVDSTPAETGTTYTFEATAG